MICSATTDNDIDYPILSWYRGAEKLPEISTDPRFSYEQDLYGITTLQIRNVSLLDQDTYECKGNNFVSEVSVTANLQVVG